MIPALDKVKAVLEPLGRPVVLSRIPPQVGQPTFCLLLSKVEPQGIARMRLWTVDVYTLTPRTEPSDADDELESVLAAALDVLDKAQPMRWAEAERGTANEAFHSFKITVQLTLQEV